MPFGKVACHPVGMAFDLVYVGERTTGVRKPVFSLSLYPKARQRKAHGIEWRLADHVVIFEGRE